MIKVLPSSNPEKEEDLLKYAKNLENLGVEYLHCDVMDGVFEFTETFMMDGNPPCLTTKYYTAVKR